jgi:hypothetical protein
MREEMVPADVVEVSMTGYCDNIVGPQPGVLGNQIHYTEPSVHQQVTIPARDMPDVTAVEGVDMRLEDVSHTVG